LLWRWTLRVALARSCIVPGDLCRVGVPVQHEVSNAKATLDPATRRLPPAPHVKYCSVHLDRDLNTPYGLHYIQFYLSRRCDAFRPAIRLLDPTPNTNNDRAQGR